MTRQSLAKPDHACCSTFGVAAALAVLGMLSVPAEAEAGQRHTVVMDELECLALAVYFEARGEPEKGQRAVAHVVMNRVDDADYPGSVCAVVKEGGQEVLHQCQFSWWCDGNSTEPYDAAAWEHSMVIARSVYWGYSEDPTDGALWFHADYVDPYWNSVFVRGPQIGLHIFYTRPLEEEIDPERSPQLAQTP